MNMPNFASCHHFMRRSRSSIVEVVGEYARTSAAVALALQAQKFILIEPCITRGERADIEVPKLVAEPKAVSLVCLMTAPVVPSAFVTARKANVIAPSMSLKFARLNIL